MSNKPVADIRLGAIRVTQWAFPMKDKLMSKFAIEGRYKDKDGNWQTSKSYTRQDLALIACACLQALQLPDPKSQSTDVGEPDSEFFGD